ncbi:Detected protein of unknown function [Hibiscus syriacus]|uniref:phosphoribosyl-ATP diphosphatase n=1 Tax=Hibiscus syriacus TaxID=106335 RepID=A0A6A3BPR0_HIBSY|nr:Detected protein of unknown function [Hibiscus syriacus]
MSNTAESSVGGSLEVVRVIEHTRNKDIWDHYDLCEMSNGSRRARCKLCLKFLASEGNTTLKNHLTKSCKALRSRSDPSQSNLTPQGGVFVYDNEKSREAFTKFVITKALPFDHFDDEDFTTTIQQLMQPRYTQESQFPILAAMARDLLTVQASTVASESAFSVSGRVISQRRSRLSPESVEVCICLKDYLDGAARKQHITTLEDAIDADLEANLHIEEVELGISLQTKKAKMMKKRWQWGNRYPYGGIGSLRAFWKSRSQTIQEEADELCRTLEEKGKSSRTASEMADVMYHAMVLLRRKDVKIENVQFLGQRFSQSGIEEKQNRAIKQS